MARRLVARASGLLISGPGVDALTALESTLPFSTTRRHLMQIGSGTFTLSSGMFVPFGIDVGAVPLVIAGIFYLGGIGYPVGVVPTTTGFNAYAGSVPSGATPAEGQTCVWRAYMKNKP